LNGATSFLYPSIALFTETEDCYIVELFGARETFTKLEVRHHKEKSINEYLNQFRKKNKKNILPSVNSYHIQDTLFSRINNIEDYKKRFPIINYFPASITLKNDGDLFYVGEDFSFVTLINCLIINQDKNITRSKYIIFLGAFRKKITEKQLVDTIDNFVHEDIPLSQRAFKTFRNKFSHAVSDSYSKKLAVISGLQSLYLTPSLRETTIGDYLRLQPQLIKDVLRTDHFIYEPYLLWLEGKESHDETAINPDLIIKRNDGYYDIYDLKTAALQHKNLTKGAHKRRRFIDYVYEGIAQLINYEEYFSFPKNHKHAKEKYGILVSKPNLYLVVGNFDNASKNEIDEALRIHPNIQLIDYDTFCQNYVEA